MKKQILFALFATLALSSCSSGQISTIPNSPTLVDQVLRTQITGTVKLIDHDLALFAIPTDPNEIKPRVTYYEAGTFKGGKYDGYHRILAMKTASDPSGPEFLTFATKDNSTYVLDDSKEQYIARVSDIDVFAHSPLDTTKVMSSDNLPTTLPLTIKLDNSYSLFKAAPDFDEQRDTSDEISMALHMNFNTAQSLSSTNTELRLFAPPTVKSALESTAADYSDGRTTVIVVDPAGLPYRYHLASTDQADTYPARRTQSNALWKQYNQAMDDAINTQQNTDKIAMPGVVLPPNLRFSNDEISLSSKGTFFSKYDTPFIYSCSDELDALISKNINENDLVKVGSLREKDIFTLRNTNHPLIKASYQTKITDIDSSLFQDYNQHRPKPTFATYAAKNPILFTHDFWGRLIMLQENEYPVPQECGKPVLYFYPQEPTKITVKFIEEVKLRTTIPTYHNGWNFLANPDGTLTDLQPQFTECKAINSNKIGSEYAQQACQNNEYPYLYWAGQVLEHTYPIPTEGWIVAKKDIEQFMDSTLDGVGLNKKEKNDMLEYWLPEMLAKNSPYYQISFLQTAEMNTLAPMSISPKPDHVFRIFLDYNPVSSTSMKLPPQTLDHVNRDGFSVVEWGGMKR